MFGITINEFIEPKSTEAPFYLNVHRTKGKRMGPRRERDTT